MTLQTEWIHYGEEGLYQGYMARFDRVTKETPVVLVIQEIWGVDDHIKDLTHRFAQAGYVAFAPDIYAKNGERVEPLKAERIEEVKAFMKTVPRTVWANPEAREKALQSMTEDEQRRITETFEKMFGGTNPEQYIDQLLVTTNFLREQHPLTQGKGIASVGYCMGGGLSALLACKDPALKAAVIYYGTAPDVEQLKNITCPVLGFYGDLDQRISEGIPALAEQMKENNKSFSYYIYENTHHAFFNDTRESYNVDAARHSFSRTLQLFDAVLSE